MKFLEALADNTVFSFFLRKHVDRQWPSLQFSSQNEFYRSHDSCYIIAIVRICTVYSTNAEGESNGSVYTGCSKKMDTQFFWDNFGNSAPILTILSLLQAEIYGA